MNANTAVHILSEEIIEKFIDQDLSIFINFSNAGHKIQILSNGAEIMPISLFDNNGNSACITDFIDLSVKIPEEFLDISPENVERIQNCEATMKILNAKNWCVVNGKLKHCPGGCNF